YITHWLRLPLATDRPRPTPPPARTSRQTRLQTSVRSASTLRPRKRKRLSVQSDYDTDLSFRGPCNHCNGRRPGQRREGGSAPRERLTKRQAPARKHGPRAGFRSPSLTASTSEGTR